MPPNASARRFRFDPVAEPARRAVGGERRADAGGQRVEGGVAVGALHDRLDLRAAPIAIGQRRQRRLGLAGRVVAQDRQAAGRHALGH